MSDGIKDLKYAIASKDAFLVISFSGKMTKNALGEIEACLGELSSRTEQKVVLNFAQVTQVDRPAIPALIKLQKALRERDQSSMIRVCHVEPDIGGMLVDTGAVRRDELKKNLQEALVSFAPPKLTVKSIIKSKIAA